MSADTTPPGPSGPRAGFWTRLGAALLDGLIITAASALFLAIDPALYYGVGFGGGLASSVALEGGETGQTLGKRALGIRVVDQRAGGSIGPVRAFIRYVGRIVSSLVVFLGYLWMLWDPEKQTWHDKMAGSVVVPASAYPV
jgi:uncharacterized RDD family membrane protein YckC